MKLQCNDCIHKNVCKNIEKWKAYNLEMEEMKEKYPVDWVENNKPFTSCSDYKRDILIGDNVNETNTIERCYGEYKVDNNNGNYFLMHLPCSYAFLLIFPCNQHRIFLFQKHNRFYYQSLSNTDYQL